MKNKIARLSAIIFCFVFALFFNVSKINLATAADDKFNQPYPRIGIFMWGATPEWFAQKGIDLIVLERNQSYAGAIKSKNSNVLIGKTADINGGIGPNILNKPEWQVKDTVTGQTIRIYKDPDVPNSGVPLYDLTKVEYQDFIANYFANFSADLDFLMTDGLWNTISFIPDNIAPSIRNGWPQANKDVLEKISEKTNKKPYVVNGDNCFGQNQNLYNGSFMEYGNPFSSIGWSDGFGSIKNCLINNRQPQIVIIDGVKEWLEKTDFTFNEFNLMRFQLATTLMTPAYFGFQPFSGLKDHFYARYFDEYEIDLGFPLSGNLGNPQCIEQTGEPFLNHCLYARFFSKGVVILNATGEEQDILDSDLKKFSQYGGPYYRFRGGQDPAWNNGEKFSSTTLAGYNKKLENPNHQILFGDALILLKEPKTIVADIIVDDNKFTSSSANEKTELKGEWKREVMDQNINNSWRQGVAPYSNETSFYAYTNIVGAEATFTPKIGVAGKYKISEWHPNSQGTESTSVSYDIKYGSGVKSGTIDQSKNSGKWNLLGEVYLAKGDSNYVKIKNTDGKLVIADAIKFEFGGSSLKADFNCDGVVNISDFGILLSNYGKTGNLSSKYGTCSSNKDININKNGSSNGRIDNLDLGIMLSCWGSPSKEVCEE
jgi:hypothetical protein